MRLLHSPFLTVVLLLLVAWAAILALSGTLRARIVERQLATLQGRIGETERENDRRAAELDRMQDPQWLALLARSRLNYKLPDETVVFVYKNEKSGTIVQPVPVKKERPNWRTWLDWLIGT